MASKGLWDCLFTLGFLFALPLSSQSQIFKLPPVLYQSGGRSARSLAVADVNKDGIPDVIVANGSTVGSGGVGVLFGIGGTPEGVISAAAMKAMGGEIQTRLCPQSDAERDAVLAAGYDLDRVLTQDDLVRSDNCFFAATGLTDGALLRGVRFGRDGARTQSLVMRSRSGTVRMIDATHRVSKLREFAAIDY